MAFGGKNRLGPIIVISQAKSKADVITLDAPGVDPGFSQGGPQLLRPKVADLVKWFRASKVSNLSRACLRTLEAFGFLMLKYAFSHILEILFL